MKTEVAVIAFLVLFVLTVPQIVKYDRSNKLLWHNPAVYFKPDEDPSSKSMNEGFSLGADVFFAGAVSLVCAGLISRKIN